MPLCREEGRSGEQEHAEGGVNMQSDKIEVEVIVVITSLGKGSTTRCQLPLASVRCEQNESTVPLIFVTVSHVQFDQEVILP